jgi:tetratricopeptide (TPR) repeat protein
LGDLYLKNGEEDKAIESYLKVAKLYGEEDLNFRAISIYKKILSINPKYIEAFHEIAQLYIKEGLAGSAKNYYQSILEIAPNDPKAIQGLQEIESPQAPRGGATSPLEAAASPYTRPFRPPETKMMAENSDLFSPPVTKDSMVPSEPRISELDKDSEMHYHLGIAYKEMELFDYAISEFEQASSSSSMKFDCYIMLGNCYLEKGDYNKSIEHYKMASQSEGLSKEKLARLNFNLGLAYEGNGMVSEAIDTFNLVLKFDRSFAEAEERIKKLQPQRK